MSVAAMAGLLLFGFLLTFLLAGIPIGFSILFRKKDRRNILSNDSVFGVYTTLGDDDEHFESVVNQTDGSEISDRVSFSSKIRYVNSENFKRAYIDCSFGAIKFYFDNAHVTDGSAEIQLELSFSGAELYIPKNWRLIDNLQRTATGMEEKNRSQADENSPVVTLTGSSKFSGIEIIYI